MRNQRLNRSPQSGTPKAKRKKESKRRKRRRVKEPATQTPTTSNVCRGTPSLRQKNIFRGGKLSSKGCKRNRWWR